MTENSCVLVLCVANVDTDPEKKDTNLINKDTRLMDPPSLNYKLLALHIDFLFGFKLR